MWVWGDHFPLAILREWCADGMYGVSFQRVCVCVYGGGIGGGWLWRISKGLKAGVTGERRCVFWGGIYKSSGGGGEGQGLILKTFNTDWALNTGSQGSPGWTPSRPPSSNPPQHHSPYVATSYGLASVNQHLQVTPTHLFRYQTSSTISYCLSLLSIYCLSAHSLPNRKKRYITVSPDCRFMTQPPITQLWRLCADRKTDMYLSSPR